MKKLNCELSNAELSELIDNYIRGLHAERNRKMLKDRLINGLLYDQLAEKYELSVCQAKRIIYKTQEQLFKHL